LLITDSYNKVKCTLAQALKLCTGRTAHWGSRGILVLPFHDHGTRTGWGVSVTPQLLFTPGKDPIPIVQEVGWAPGPVWTGVENLAPTGIWSPDRPAHSQSLYRQHYSAHKQIHMVHSNVQCNRKTCHTNIYNTFGMYENSSELYPYLNSNN